MSELEQLKQELDDAPPEVQEAPEADEVEVDDAGDDDGEPQAAAPAPKPVDASVEREARDMGWVPQEEWRGNPDAWRPADEFVKRGQEVLPIVRSNLERERRKVSDLEKRIQDVQNTYEERFRRMEAMSNRALELQKQKFWQEMEDRKAQAVSEGDTEAYERFKKAQMDGLDDFDIPEPEPQKKPAEAPEVPQEVQKWVERNPWFTNQRYATVIQAAHAYHQELLAEKPYLSLEENLAEVERFAKEKFPEKFGGEAKKEPPKKAHAPSYEGGGRQPIASGSDKKGWNDLPAEAKAAGQKYIEKGWFGDDPKAAKQKYAEEYWSQ